MQHPEKVWDIQEAIMDQVRLTALPWRSSRVLTPAHDRRETSAGRRALP